ncbi:TPA: hypothetical protein ACG1PT_000576, partial [Escherichia coli]
ERSLYKRNNQIIIPGLSAGFSFPHDRLPYLTSAHVLTHELTRQQTILSLLLTNLQSLQK